METSLSVENDDTEKTRKGLVLRELKGYGVKFEEDEALKAPEHTLERLLQEVKSKQDNTSTTQSEHLFMDSYESILCDYITKLTVATVFFFSCYPWAALFWPPYYYLNDKRHEK